MNNGQGLVAGDPVVSKAGNLPRTRSKFGLGYNFFTTHRFGEISPFFWMENVDGDKSNHLNSSSKIDSYTLKSPLMQDIKLKKDLFYVPRQAILPLNWEKFYTNPNIGEDVPEDCGTGVRSFWFKVGELCRDSSYRDALEGNNDFVSRLVRIFKWLIFFEMFYSDGSLLSNLGIHGSKFASFNMRTSDVSVNDWNFDQVFDYFTSPAFWSLDPSQPWGFPVYFQPSDGPDDVYYVTNQSVLPDSVEGDYSKLINLREFFDLLRDDLVSYVSGPESDAFGLKEISVLDDFSNFSVINHAIESTSEVDGDDLDLARLWAYQLVCHHFYSNDHVDYIYSAELFRQYIGSLIFSYNGLGVSDSFVVNGITYVYDYLSAHYLDYLFSEDLFSYPALTALAQSTFSFRHSLRFVDYFTGARTRPLAVGDTDVDVNNNVASVIDITRNIQKQRFLNALNRVGRKIADYSKLMGGDGMRPDFHDPLYIGHTADTIYGERSEYTGNVENAQQNNITSLLKNAGSRYGFSWDVDRPGIVIGVCYFDISRVYTKSIERQAFHMNRFDMFNSFMQFIGDQKIYKSELLTGGQTPFGYANRHIEYKTRFDQAAGGFVADSGLPEWIFAAERGYRKYEDNISPKFIRSSNSEFDRFYVNLTGYSLGTYFHFIARHFNDCSSSRPMAVAPDILQ